MKKYFLILLVAFCGCKKSSSSNSNSNAKASYTFEDTGNPTGSSVSFASGPGVELDCTYNPNFPAGGYNFVLSRASPQEEVLFTIPAFTTGTTLHFNYSPWATPDYAVGCGLYDGSTSIYGSDTVILTVTISRYSNSTLDGSFAMTIKDFYGDSASITGGSFNDVQLESQ